ncbi:MAG: ThiF family adenylyltransferase [Deltaproteobacteria bacterium]|nr:ThiF family adenylyltransferase [Deltaproteobacteria bacterium]
MILKIGEDAWSSFISDMLARLDVETAGLLFARKLAAMERDVLVVERAFVVPEPAYVIRAHDQIRIDPVALNRLTRPARDHGWSVFTVHTHPGAGSAQFSWADDQGDARLMPAFAARIPGVDHGSVVLAAPAMAAARCFDHSGSPSAVGLRTVGATIRTLGTGLPTKANAWFHRQALALGEQGQAALRLSRVGIVGLGGTGSLVAAQLAHLGVGELVLLDADVVEDSNVPRIVGARLKDAGHARKVDVATRYIDELGLSVKHQAVPRALAGEAELALLRGCDVVFSCVDTHSPRALLNRLAYDALVPVIDMGTAFRVDDSGALIGDSGRVVVVGPGKPCLACWGHLDPERIRVEALSQAEREEEVRAGYIEGAGVAQPSVIAFNAAVASAAVIEFLRIVTGFAASAPPPQRLAFSFSDGTVRRNRLAGSSACTICGRASDG